MVTRLKITHDILSDINLEFTKKLNLPTFNIDSRVFLKRMTLIIEKSIIKTAQNLDSLSAGKMGMSTSDVGDMVKEFILTNGE